MRSDRLGGDRLTLRLSLAIAALVTSLLAVGLYALSEHHFRRLVEGRRQAAELQNRILETALRHQMLEKHPEGKLIATILREVGSEPEVQNVMILDHEGVVSAIEPRGARGEALLTALGRVAWSATRRPRRSATAGPCWIYPAGRSCAVCSPIETGRSAIRVTPRRSA